MSIVVTGSIAFDYLMSFPGKFTEHFLPEHMSRVSLSFLVDTMDKRRGGCAPNIAYTLALLGERPRLMATAGQDFDDYRRWLEAAGVDTSLVARSDGEVHGVVLLQHRHREQPDRVVLHGAMANAARAVVPRRRRTARWRSSRRTIPQAMVQYAEECRTLGMPFIWDPGQQCARMSGPELQTGFEALDARHLQRLRVRADAAEDRHRREHQCSMHTETLVITRGEEGCSIYTREGRNGCAGGAAVSVSSIRPASAMPSARFMKGLAQSAALRGVRPAGRRGGDLRARAPWRPEPCLHLGGIRCPVRGQLRPSRDQLREPEAGPHGCGAGVADAPLDVARRARQRPALRR